MRKHKIWKIDTELIQKALDTSTCYIDVFKQLNLEFSKSMIKMLIYRAKVDNINRKNFQENNKRTIFFKGKNLNEILIKNSNYFGSVNLKNKLFKNNIFKNECHNCGITEWNGKSIVLQLHHINGKNNDNRLENLIILCPNCHSQTDTYAGKKKKEKIKKEKKCIKCKCVITNGLYCKKCNIENSIKKRRVERPTYENLMIDIKKLGYSATGRKYGVSDNGIRKWKIYYEKIPR